MAIGWLTDVAEADTYFEDERFSTVAWDALLETGSPTFIFQRTKILTQAYNRIRYCKTYPLIPASPNATQLKKLQMAQCELAYYFAIHLIDEDRRKGIQAQGVVSAGIVKESYDRDFLMRLPIPAFVDDLLEEFKYQPVLAIGDIGRVEDLSVKDDVEEYEE